jgi:hypothetical protein
VGIGAVGDKPWNLRWIMIHMIEEYARPLGHADLIREAIDGTKGCPVDRSAFDAAADGVDREQFGMTSIGHCPCDVLGDVRRTHEADGGAAA